MNIVAKWRTLCPACGLVIAAGDAAEWTQGERARHLACAAPPHPDDAPVRTMVVRGPPHGAIQITGGGDVAAVVAALVVADARLQAAEAAPAEAAPSETRVASSTPTRQISRRPRQTVTTATPEDLAWDPLALPLYTVEDDGILFAGDFVAIVRPDVRCWPLSTGSVSSRYRVYSHCKVDADTRAACVGSLAHRQSLICGQGTRIVHEYDLTSTDVSSVPCEEAIVSRLIQVVPHTGTEALTARLVLYVGGNPIGSVQSARAIHVSSNPAAWSDHVAALIQDSVIVHTVVADLLTAAKGLLLTTAERKWLRKRGIVVKNSALTLFGAMCAWHGSTSRGGSKPTWGVWSRRLDDRAIMAMALLLPAIHAESLDGAIGGDRYRRARARATAAKTVAS